MRKITEHEHNDANRRLEIMATDELGHGGANHVYSVKPASYLFINGVAKFDAVDICFQNGPIKSQDDFRNITGVNGVTHEALIAIVLDRMRAFPAGPYNCRQNAIAITKLEEAMHWLLDRTREREVRGVEGTHEI